MCEKLYKEMIVSSAMNPLKRKIPYGWDLNIYRGCEHGCKYCYAMYSHDYLGNGDFFGDIYAKTNILDELEKGFKEFLGGLKDGDIKSEYLLPSVVDQLIKDGKANVSVLETNDKWFGVTYKEDKPVVVESIRKLISEGKYPEKLYN